MKLQSCDWSIALMIAGGRNRPISVKTFRNDEISSSPRPLDYLLLLYLNCTSLKTLKIWNPLSVKPVNFTKTMCHNDCYCCQFQ